MLTNVLQSNELEKLEKERRKLQFWLIETNQKTERCSTFELKKLTYVCTRLTAINASLSEHYRNCGDYITAEVEIKEHSFYANIIKRIRQNAKIPQYSLKHLEMKLPTIVVGDVASWIEFRKAVETISFATNISEEEKTFQLLAALPASEQIYVQGLAFKQAVEKLKERFESPKALVNTVRTQFKTISKSTFCNEIERFRAINLALSLVLDLSNQHEIRLEAFNCAIQLLPQPVYWTYVHTKSTRELQNLIDFIKNHIQGLSWLELAVGTDCSFLKN